MPFHPSQIPDFFWDIIERADNAPARLWEILLEADKNTIYKFAGEFSSAAIELTGKPYENHMDVESEDLIGDICQWVVGQGKDYYQNIWNNPEFMPKYSDIQTIRLLGYVADSVYEEKFGEEMPDTIDERGYPIHNDINLE